MKPTAKKTIIIIAAVLVVALIVWLVFFRKKEWEKIIDNLDLSATDKTKLKQAVQTLLSDPYYQDKKQVEADAIKNGTTYDKWLVILAATEVLNWTSGLSNGIVVVKPNN